MAKEFDGPLDTPVYEQQFVDRPEIVHDPKTGTSSVKMVKEPVLVKTIYSKKSHYANICSNFSHNWVVTDRHRYIASCTNCPMKRYLDPTKHTVIKGNIVDRITKMPV